MLKRWELALMAGLLAGLLISPVRAQSLPLSRWRVPEKPAPVQYQISLFPFAVGTQSAPALSRHVRDPQPEIKVRFRLAEWWGEIQESIAP